LIGFAEQAVSSKDWHHNNAYGRYTHNNSVVSYNTDAFIIKIGNPVIHVCEDRNCQYLVNVVKGMGNASYDYHPNFYREILIVIH
jgi:hypothetical protein